MAELVYAHDSDSCGAILGGSSPLMPTTTIGGRFIRGIIGPCLECLDSKLHNNSTNVYKSVRERMLLTLMTNYRGARKSGSP